MSSNLHRASVAEAILSLVVASDRAAAIAGDLVEEGSRQNRRFWLDLGGVALFFFFRGLWCAPLRSLFLMASGLVLWFVIYLLLRIGGSMTGLQPLEVGLLDCSALSGLAFAYLASMLALSNLTAGAVLSLASRADRPSGCVPLAMFWAAAAITLPILDRLSASPSWGCTLLYVFVLPFLYVTPLLIGGVLARTARAAR